MKQELTPEQVQFFAEQAKALYERAMNPLPAPVPKPIQEKTAPKQPVKRRQPRRTFVTKEAMKAEIRKRLAEPRVKGKRHVTVFSAPGPYSSLANKMNPAISERIIELHDAGKPLQEIAHVLDAEYPKGNGKSWGRWSVQYQIIRRYGINYQRVSRHVKVTAGAIEWTRPETCRVSGPEDCIYDTVLMDKSSDKIITVDTDLLVDRVTPK